jgi:RHS repeat-associated protein
MWRWDPDTFGSAAPNTNPSGLGAFTYNLRFPGQYYLSESGLLYNYYRDLDPQTGRYIESDPIGLQGGINTYSYAGSNPIGHMDPTACSNNAGRDWTRLTATILVRFITNLRAGKEQTEKRCVGATVATRCRQLQRPCSGRLMAGFSGMTKTRPRIRLVAVRTTRTNAWTIAQAMNGES